MAYSVPFYILCCFFFQREVTESASTALSPASNQSHHDPCESEDDRFTEEITPPKRTAHSNRTSASLHRSEVISFSDIFRLRSEYEKRLTRHYFSQAIKVCVFCGHFSRWKKRLEQHIKRFHEAELLKRGETACQNMMFWHSKSGMRRCGYGLISARINKMMRDGNITKTLVFEIVKKCLAINLVCIADDENL